MTNYIQRYWRDATPVQRLMIVLLDSRSIGSKRHYMTDDDFT